MLQVFWLIGSRSPDAKKGDFIICFLQFAVCGSRVSLFFSQCGAAGSNSMTLHLHYPTAACNMIMP